MKHIHLSGILLIVIGICGNAHANAPSRYRILIQDDGVYRVSHQMLADAGFSGEHKSSGLALTNRGEPIALWVADGGDGLFGPGDWIEFVGEHLAGKENYYNNHFPFNVYFLEFGATPGYHMHATVATQAAKPWELGYLSELHLEQDNLRAELTDRITQSPNNYWYWQKLHHLSSLPFSQPLSLGGFDTQSISATQISAQFRGWSDQQDTNDGFTDHVIELGLNGQALASGAGDGRNVFHVTARLEQEKAASMLLKQANKLSVAVPKRRRNGDADPIIDVVYLDWIKVRFPRQLAAQFGQFQVELPAPPVPQGWSRHAVFGPQPPVAYTKAGGRMVASADGSIAERFYVDLPSNTEQIWISTQDQLLDPKGISAANTSPAPLVKLPVDYLILAHPALLAEIQPLASHHRKKGLAVAVVNVFDIYEQFAHGIIHPAAIRDFIDQTIAAQKPTKLRFVLLVGDASWWHKYNQDPYQPSNWSTNNNLLPSWSIPAFDGFAASDNPFVAESPQDSRPKSAIGRLPVRTPEELHTVVEKFLTYANLPQDASEHQRALLLSEHSRPDQRRNSRLSKKLSAARLSSSEILFSPNAKQNFSKVLRDRLDDGLALVHFYGHGGRYMWQTSAEAPADSDNVFQMTDLDKLQPRQDWPFVLSMTCSSGPFDHPNADSLAEKFLTTDKRGAIAVLAASARNAPSTRLSEKIIEFLGEGNPMGEAVMKAKRDIPSERTRQLYNFFGDPALPIRLPTQ